MWQAQRTNPYIGVRKICVALLCDNIVWPMADGRIANLLYIVAV